MSPEIERAGIPLWQKAAASGVASLDGDGKVVQDPATSYLPLAGGEMSGNITMAAAETVDGVDVSAHAANLAAHMESYWRVLRTGRDIYPMPVQSLPAGSAITANTLYTFPFVVPRDMTISAFKVQVSGAGAGGTTARLGVYNDGTNLYPGTLKTDLGVVAVDGAGTKTITPGAAISFTKGLYWLALVSDGTPTFTFMIPIVYVLGVADPTSISIGWSVAFTFDALPTPFPESAAIQASIRIAWSLTLSSLD